VRAFDDALALHVTGILCWQLAHTTNVKERQSMRWVDDEKEEILMACKWTLDASTRWRLGRWEHTHNALEVRVCTRSNEISHNFRVELVGVHGHVKRSVSVLQQKKKKKKIENRDRRK
jgi:hypothetical protein